MKKLLAAVTVVSLVLLALAAFSPGASATAEANNWYVCKYVGPPGTPDETLAGGNNPIFVDENAIDVTPVTIGATFGDAQTHSVVVAGPYAPPGIDPEPTCPTTPPPSETPPPCPNGTQTVTVTHTETVTAAPLTAEDECTVTTTITVTKTVSTTTPPPPPPPTSTTVTTPPPTTPCPGSVHLGPWYGDPRVNIDLKGDALFVVRGGVQRFTGRHRITADLACNQTLRIGRYKVSKGHHLIITQDGVVVVDEVPPVLR